MPTPPTPPLAPQTTMLPLFAGQDSSIDPRVLQPGYSAIVENGRLQNRGQLRKRYGFGSLSRQDLQNTTITTGVQGFSAGNTLFHHDGGSLRAWEPNPGAWNRLGSYLGAPIRGLNSIQSVNDVGEMSSAASAKFVVVAWTELNALYYSVIDLATGDQLVSRAPIGMNIVMPSVVQWNGDFYLFAQSSAAYVAYIIRGAAPTLLSGQIALPLAIFAPGSAIIPSFSVALEAQASQLVGAFIVDDTNVLKIAVVSFTPALAMTTIATLVPPGPNALFGGVNPPNYVTISPLGARIGAATNPRLVTYSSSYLYHSAPPAPWIDYTAVVTDTGSVTLNGLYSGVTIGAGLLGGNFRVMFGVSGSNFIFSEVTGAQVSVQNAATATGIQVFSFANGNGGATTQTVVPVNSVFATDGNLRIASRAFSVNGQAYVWALSDSGFQSQYFLIDQTGSIVATSQVNGAGAPWDGLGRSFASPVPDASGSVVWAERFRSELRFDSSGNAFTTIGATVRTQAFAQQHAYAEQFDGVNYISSPAPQIYDGASQTEWGFYYYPRLQATAQTGGNLTGGTYFLTATYAWYDATGKLWRSPTSLTVTVAGVTAGGSIQCTVPYLFGTKKTGVMIEIWCTANISSQTGVTQFKVASVANISSPFPAGLGVAPQQYATITVLGPDSSFTGNELIYTSGGVPSFSTPPPLSFMSSSGLRLYGVAGESNSVFVTTPAGPGSPLNFTEVQSLVFESGAQPIVACQVMDNVLYAASNGSWFATNADTNDLSAPVITFQPPRRLPVASGVASAPSVLLSSEGIYHQNETGIALLARNQVVVFVGEQVKNYAAPVLDAYRVTGQQQLRFVQGSQTLCYDYINKVWTQYVWGQASVVQSGCSYRGGGVMMTADGVTRLESTASFLDDGYPVIIRVETPWFRPGGFPGWGRTWRFMVVGERRSKFTLQVRIAYEDDPTWIDALQISSEAEFSTPSFGGGLGTFGRLLPLGPGNPFGINPAGNAMKFVGIMPRQKAGSFKFEVSEVGPTSEDIVLNYLALLFGTFAGQLGQTPTGKKFG